MKDKTNPVNFGSESEMAAAIAAAKAKKVPVGGVPMPKMPRLDQPVPSNTMGVQKVPGAHRVLTPEEQQKLQERGHFIPGAGSAYVANQPMAGSLAATEEEQSLEIDPRLAPRPPGAGLRQETIEQLQVVAAANADKNDEELKKINEEIDEIDDVFETNEFGERVRSLLANKKRAEAISNRCQPLSFEDLLLYGSVKQKVPIIPGKFEPTFRSLSGEENVEILRLMGKVHGPDQYVLDTLSIYKLTAGLFALNSKVLPNHLDSDGDFSEDLFKAKNKIILRMALPILSDLVVNYGWFAARVQKLTVIDDIKSF